MPTARSSRPLCVLVIQWNYCIVLSAVTLSTNHKRPFRSATSDETGYRYIACNCPIISNFFSSKGLKQIQGRGQGVACFVGFYSYQRSFDLVDFAAAAWTRDQHGRWLGDGEKARSSCGARNGRRWSREGVYIIRLKCFSWSGEIGLAHRIRTVVAESYSTITPRRGLNQHMTAYFRGRGSQIDPFMNQVNNHSGVSPPGFPVIMGSIGFAQKILQTVLVDCTRQKPHHILCI